MIHAHDSGRSASNAGKCSMRVKPITVCSKHMQFMEQVSH